MKHNLRKDAKAILMAALAAADPTAAVEKVLRARDDLDRYVERAVRVDPDLWVVEIEDKHGRHFLTEPVENR